MVLHVGCSICIFTNGKATLPHIVGNGAIGFRFYFHILTLQSRVLDIYIKGVLYIHMAGRNSYSNACHFTLLHRIIQAGGSFIFHAEVLRSNQSTILYIGFDLAVSTAPIDAAQSGCRHCTLGIFISIKLIYTAIDVGNGLVDRFTNISSAVFSGSLIGVIATTIIFILLL